MTNQDFLSKQLEKVRQIKNGDYTWNELNNFRMENGCTDISTDSLRRSFQQLTVYDEAGWLGVPAEGTVSRAPVFDKAVTSMNFDNNETTSEKLVELTSAQLYDPDQLMRAHGFDPDAWTIKSANNSKVERYGITGDTETYASRIVVRPRSGKDIGFKDVENFFEGFNTKRFSGLKIKPTQYDPKGEFLEVCLQDVHMGLLSWDDETGESYDCDIARERVEKLMSEVIDRCKGKKYKRIVFALLGDILHIDNANGTTTKGTVQDTDTRPARLFDEALEMLIWCVQSLGTIAPVEVVNVQGNHDNLSSYMLCRSLEMAFRNDDKVTFFNTPNPRKARRYGNVLLAWAHGDMKNNAITEWLSNEYPEDWGQSKYREVHCGHLHSTQTLQKIEDNKHGLIARYLPALCASSAWEHSMAFPKSLRSLVCFEWNEEKGLRSIWYNNV